MRSNLIEANYRSSPPDWFVHVYSLINHFRMPDGKHFRLCQEFKKKKGVIYHRKENIYMYIILFINLYI